MQYILRDQMELEKVYFVNQIMLTEPNEKIMHFDENKSNLKSSFFSHLLTTIRKICFDALSLKLVRYKA